MASRKQHRYTLLTSATFIIFLIVWQIAGSLGLLGNYTPTPYEVLQAFFFKLDNIGPDGSLLITNILSSLYTSFVGFVIAVVVGIPLGLLMGWYKLFSRFINPIFEIIRPIPAIAWIPLMIVWVGVGITAKALIIFFAAFVSCVINAYTGIRQTNPALINVAKTYGASNFYTFIHVGIPSAVPMIFAGLKIALSTSWGTLVAAEMLAASSGLGYMISMARQFGRADIVVLGMVVIGLLGFLFNFIFNIIEAFVNKGGSV